MKLPIKRYVIIGSYALGTRYAKDIDVVCYYDEIEVECKKKDDYVATFIHEGRRIECLLADKQDSFKQIMAWYEKIRDDEPDLERWNYVALYDDLYAIKAGHIVFPHKRWEKHISDYHILKQRFDGDDGLTDKGRQYVIDLAELHSKSTQERIGKQKLPKLKNVTKEKFFDDKVVKYMDHDSIHQMVAHKEKPMYSYMQPDPSKVYCDEKLWNEFSEEDKIHCVMEECYVIALERHIIPTMHGDKIGLGYQDAFKWALMRVCTTLTSGFFRQFAIDNYFTVLNNYNKEYYKLLKLPEDGNS